MIYLQGTGWYLSECFGIRLNCSCYNLYSRFYHNIIHGEKEQMMKEFLKKYPNPTEAFDKVWTTSDHHFGHKKILDFEPVRQELMDAAGWEGTHDDFMIEHWNNNVGKNDLVLHLGDLAFKNLEGFISKLNGTILLVLGNHDRKPMAYINIPNIYVVDGIWEFIGNLPPRKYETGSTDPLLSGLIINQVLFSHYPIFSEDKYDLRNERIVSRVAELRKVALAINKHMPNIHGHSHSQTAGCENSLNVCIDNNKFVMKDIT